MRRSSMVQLTLLPLLASATLARADTITDNPPPMEPTTLSPPGMTEPTEPPIRPPGMTQPVTCVEDPALPDCPRTGGTHHAFSGVVRGGFGGYFAAGGGGGGG